MESLLTSMYHFNVIIFFTYLEHFVEIYLCDLCDCTSTWLNLIHDQDIQENVKDEISRRFKQVATPFHLLAYLIDHRKKDLELNECPHIKLTPDQEEKARNVIFDHPDASSLTMVLAAYETEDATIFPKAAFNSLSALSPIKYWEYIRKISKYEPVQKFCSMMMAVSACPPSSAGIERLFSSAALIQTKIRNRLSNKRVQKLVHVSRYFNDDKNVNESMIEELNLVAEMEDEEDF